MKEIKFRYVLKDRNSEDIISMIFDLKFIEEWSIERIYESFEEKYAGECNCLNESCNHCECGTIFDNYEITSRDQYTGLKDKNGVEIYEGDIIRGDLYEWDLPTMGCIIYDSEHSVFANKNDGGITFLFRIKNIEIIGNIHENPELLKG